MSNLNIKPTHKPIKTYYAELKEYKRLDKQNEGTVCAAFQELLQHYSHPSNLTRLCKKTHYTQKKRRIIPSGEVVYTFKLPYDYWEAKDMHDIVYTPQPIVDFMVKSVAHILKTELIGQGTTVSSETVDIIEGLPALDLKILAQG